MSSLFSDVRSAVRSLRAAPAFAVATIGILALGIGANTAIYSMVEPILFRRLAVVDPDRLVRIYAVEEGVDLSNSSLPVFEDYRDGSRSFSALAAFADFIPLHMILPGSGPERVTGALATGSYFGVLGVKPARGRYFGPDDERAGNPVVVLSDRLWRTRFGADPSVVGKTVRLNRRAFAVVGVAPGGFYGASLESIPDLWMPVSLAADADPEWGPSVRDRGFSWLDMVGRLAPGVSVRQAQAELEAFAKRRAAGQPEGKRDPMPRLVPVRDALVYPGETTTAASRLAWILFGVVFLVLSITCADAAGLLLARGERRRREIAIRSALGASHGRIARQLLAESLLLSFAGAAIGLAVGAGLVDVVRSMAPAGFPIPVDAAASVLDARVLAFSALAAAVTGAAFGLLPTLRAARRDAWSDLKGSTLRLGRSRLPLRDAFSAAQIALCAVLLVGAGLLLRTLAAERAVKLGFDAEDALVFSVDLSRQGYPIASHPAVFERIADAVRHAPGVRSAAVGRMVPVDTSGMIVTLDRSKSARARAVDFNPVGPGFFKTLGVRLLQGREFDARDAAGAPGVAVVNRTLAEREWPGQPVLGRVLPDVGPMHRPLTIVGVVDDARFRSLRDPVRPMLSVPFAQLSRPASSILVRLDHDSAAGSSAIAGIRSAVASVDAELPVFAVRSLRDRIGRSLGQERLLATLLTAFGALALLLAGTGLYGVVSSSVETRRRELGIRVALGAQRSEVLRLVLRRGLLLAGLGLAIGIPAAFAASRALSTVLFGVTAADAATFAAAAAVLAAVAGLSGLLPARRASRTDPMESLRSE